MVSSCGREVDDGVGGFPRGLIWHFLEGFWLVRSPLRHREEIMHYCQEDITEGSGPHRPQLDDAQQLLRVAVRVAGGRGNHVSARVEDVIFTVHRNIL